MELRTDTISYIRAAIRMPVKKALRRDCIDRKRNYFFFKRVFDGATAFLVIAGVLSWLLPVLALLIRLDSRGPVFFLQRRVGRGGKLFTCYKLRTMVVNIEADQCPAAEEDSRITRIGKFLRRSNLDELPQLFNVLFGAMSLVGPRPHMLSDCNKFSRVMPEYKFRNFVKPGITGLAQIEGFHGPATDFPTIFWRYQWDAFYVRNAGPLLDFRILRRTILLFLTQQMPLCK